MTDVLAQKEMIDLILDLALGFGIAFFALLTAWGYDWFKRTPKAAKIVKAAKNQHRGIVVLQGDDGKVTFKIGFKIRPEGIVETKPEGSKPKKPWVGLIARKVEVPKIEVSQSLLNGGEKVVDDEKTKEDVLKVAQLLSDEATKPSFLDECGPILFSYSGKAILTRIGHLAALKLLDRVKQIFPNALTSVDFTTLKTLFPMPWDETQLDAQGQMKFNEGFAAGRKGEDKNREFKILLMMLITLFGIIAAAVLILKFL